MPRVEIVYATPAVQRRYTVDLADGETVRAAIDQCGVLRECPEIDLARERIGVHGRLAALPPITTCPNAGGAANESAAQSRAIASFMVSALFGATERLA